MLFQASSQRKGKRKHKNDYDNDRAGQVPEHRPQCNDAGTQKNAGRGNTCGNCSWAETSHRVRHRRKTGRSVGYQKTYFNNIGRRDLTVNLFSPKAF